MELTPENLDRKFSRLDFKPDVDGRTVNTEMQVNRESDFRIMENERHEILTEKFSIHFFELRKSGKCRKTGGWRTGCMPFGVLMCRKQSFYGKKQLDMNAFFCYDKKKRKEAAI